MTLAIRGGQASSLNVQLSPAAWLLAVARGFGSIDGVAVENALLAQLRNECERCLRSARFRRAIGRPHDAAAAVVAALARVNARLYARTASHDDYVTAASSLTVVLVVQGRAYVIHAGSTAAYLSRGGELFALCADDALSDSPLPLLSRSVGGSSRLDVSVSNVALDEGDMILLVGRRLRGDGDRRALLEHLAATAPGDQILMARFEPDTPEDSSPSRYTVALAAAVLVRIAAAATFLFALVYAH